MEITLNYTKSICLFALYQQGALHLNKKFKSCTFQEIPYGFEQRLIDWKELRDGSLRIEQHFITHKLSQQKLLLGKKGSKIGYVIFISKITYVVLI